MLIGGLRIWTACRRPFRAPAGYRLGFRQLQAPRAAQRRGCHARALKVSAGPRWSRIHWTGTHGPPDGAQSPQAATGSMYGVGASPRRSPWWSGREGLCDAREACPGSRVGDQHGGRCAPTSEGRARGRWRGRRRGPETIFMALGTIAPSARGRSPRASPERGVRMLDTPCPVARRARRRYPDHHGGRPEGRLRKRSAPVRGDGRQDHPSMRRRAPARSPRPATQIITGVGVASLAEAQFSPARVASIPPRFARCCWVAWPTAASSSTMASAWSIVFAPGFKSWMHLKDMRIVLSEGPRCGSPAERGRCRAALFGDVGQRAWRRGFGRDAQALRAMSGGSDATCGGAMRVGFVGLGAMGRPMAENLLRRVCGERVGAPPGSAAPAGGRRRPAKHRIGGNGGAVRGRGLDGHQ